jgi:hypothetical protein
LSEKISTGKVVRTQSVNVHTLNYQEEEINMSYILYEGPSMIDAKPIVVIMTGTDRPTQNKKTGPLVTTWTLRSDIPPTEAVKTGEDSSVCGSCVHRGTSCYVLVHQAPSTIYKAYKAGKYTRIDAKKAGYNRDLRLGGYGDMAAPTSVWEALVSKSRMHVGYTHLHQTRPDLKGLVQASADSVEEALMLQEKGWKTFRTKLPSDPLLPGEIYCPNERTGIQCTQCALCDGRTKNIAINTHGAKNKVKAYEARALK